MTKKEFEAWAAHQMKVAGRWTKCPVREHNRDELFFYNGRPDDPSKGIFVSIEKDGSFECGRYTDAVPHIGEGSFTVRVRRKFVDRSEAFAFAVERLGLSFLLAVTHGVSPL